MAAASCFAVLTIYWMLSVGISDISFISLDSVTYLVNNFQICLALLIVSVPEGLPLAISMALACSFERLVQANV